MFAVSELNGHLDLKSKYVYTNGMLVGRIDSDGKLYQYFHDGLGSITMICDSTGSYRNLYLYDDFGNFRKKVENTTNHYYYTGQERDESPSGLYNLRARYYASALGRFTQEDPVWRIGYNGVGSCAMYECSEEIEFSSFGLSISIGEIFNFLIYKPQGLNPYVYTSNNPLNGIDIYGLLTLKDIKCLYYSALCGFQSRECKKRWREKIECMEPEEVYKLMVLYNVSSFSGLYTKICWSMIESCQKMLKFCTESATDIR